jgi:hypothetical protein
VWLCRHTDPFTHTELGQGFGCAVRVAAGAGALDADDPDEELEPPDDDAVGVEGDEPPVALAGAAFGSLRYPRPFTIWPCAACVCGFPTTITGWP